MDLKHRINLFIFNRYPCQKKLYLIWISLFSFVPVPQQWFVHSSRFLFLHLIKILAIFFLILSSYLLLSIPLSSFLFHSISLTIPLCLPFSSVYLSSSFSPTSSLPFPFLIFSLFLCLSFHFSPFPFPHFLIYYTVSRQFFFWFSSSKKFLPPQPSVPFTSIFFFIWRSLSTKKDELLFFRYSNTTEENEFFLFWYSI